MAGRVSGKGARFRYMLKRGSVEKHRRNDLPRRALAFFLIVSPDQEENLNNPFASFAPLRFRFFTLQQIALRVTGCGRKSLCVPVCLAGGDGVCPAASGRRTRNENPDNPVDPVKTIFLK